MNSVGKVHVFLSVVKVYNKHMFQSVTSVCVTVILLCACQALRQMWGHPVIKPPIHPIAALCLA
jgi:hypothetical protein